MIFNRAAAIAAIAFLAAACAPGGNAPETPQPTASAAANSMVNAPLTSAQQAWVEQMLRGLSLRDKVGQMIVMWIDGSYLPEGGPEYERLRTWVQDLKIGGIIMSVGPPMEIAAKLN